MITQYSSKVRKKRKKRRKKRVGYLSADKTPTLIYILSLAFALLFHNKHTKIKYANIALTIITIHRAQSPLCLLFLVRLGGYIVNSLDCYFERFIGKLTSFLWIQEFSFHNKTVDYSTSTVWRSRPPWKGKVGRNLVKVAPLRVNLNVDGTPITSKTHTHPSHSQTSSLLTSYLSLGVPVPPATQCMWDV